MHIHTHTHRWAPKTATLGNGEFPKPQSGWGWGESWESRMPACSATEWADWARAKTDKAKKRRQQNNTHPDLANRWQHTIVQRLMSEIYPHNVVGKLAGHPGRHVGWGRLITVLLPVWHNLGKPRWEDKVGVRASEVWQYLWQSSPYLPCPLT